MPLFPLGDDGNIGYSTFPFCVDRMTPVPSQPVPARLRQSQPVPASQRIVPSTLPYYPSPSQPHYNP